METISSKDNSGKKYIAFFDLDGTLISANSGKELILYAYKKGFITWPDLLRGIYLSLLYRFEFKDTDKIINSMLGWLKGVSVTGLIALAEEIFRDSLMKSIRPEVVDRIVSHKKDGGMVVILSSAIVPVCRAIADHLEMDDVICSTLETGMVFLPEILKDLLFRERESYKIEEFCKNNNINPCHSWYYGDSTDDLPVRCVIHKNY